MSDADERDTGTDDGRCRYLDYRTETDDRRFDVPRAYCTAAGRFVQPMRADVCNEQYGLDPAEHCEIYREAASE